MATPKHYQPLDIKDAEAPLWPAVVPKLTGPEALRAGRKLWRWAEGSLIPVRLTSGNRKTWTAWEGDTLVLKVNPDKGWKTLVHYLSHLFHYRANPGDRPHSKHHARFEAKMIREVIRRGWLNGALDDTRPRACKPPPVVQDPRAVKLERIEARITSWERKAKRAENALKKLRKQQRYYVRALENLK
jgi:hypothetical protein